MKQITLGTGGPTIGRIGLGLMGMSAFYTGKGQDDAESIRTIHRALELGVNFLDTAEIYGPYANEELLARAIAGRRDEVVIATKFGTLRHTRDNSYGPDGTPENVQPRPDALKIASFSSPRCTPIQYSDGASRWAITSPASHCSTRDCASTSAWCSGASVRNHAHWPNSVASAGSGPGSGRASAGAAGASGGATRGSCMGAGLRG